MLFPFHRGHRAVKNGWDHLFPLCRDQHNILHIQGITKPSLLLLKNSSVNPAYSNQKKKISLLSRYNMS